LNFYGFLDVTVFVVKISIIYLQAFVKAEIISIIEAQLNFIHYAYEKSS